MSSKSYDVHGANSADLANNLGILYVETGEAAKGETEFTRAIELAPLDPGGYLNLAMLYARTRERRMRGKCWIASSRCTPALSTQ